MGKGRIHLPQERESKSVVPCLAGGCKKMFILSLIRRYQYIKKLDILTFPEKPIPLKIVLRGKGPAAYWKDVKKRGEKITKEWYEVVIIARSGDDFSRAVHEVRHRVQQHYPKMALFTKDKLVEIQRKNPQKAIQQILDYLEAVEKKYQELLPETEQDAIIMEKLIEQKCQAGYDSLKTASQWIKQAPEILLPPLFSSP